MSITHIGVRVPSDRDTYYEQSSFSEYGNLSGMEYAVYESNEDSLFCLIGTSHDAVGLVTWWLAPNLDEAERWVTQQKDDAESTAADASYSEVLTAFAAHRDEILDALLEGLARLGAQGGDWDSGSIEALVGPVQDALKRHGIPYIGSADTDAVAFWEGVALKHGAL